MKKFYLEPDARFVNINVNSPVLENEGSISRIKREDLLLDPCMSVLIPNEVHEHMAVIAMNDQKLRTLKWQCLQ